MGNTTQTMNTFLRMHACMHACMRYEIINYSKINVTKIVLCVFYS